jgi:hypothetical protein
MSSRAFRARPAIRHGLRPGRIRPGETARQGLVRAPTRQAQVRWPASGGRPGPPARPPLGRRRVQAGQRHARAAAGHEGGAAATANGAVGLSADVFSGAAGLGSMPPPIPPRWRLRLTHRPCDSSSCGPAGLQEHSQTPSLGLQRHASAPRGGDRDEGAEQLAGLSRPQGHVGVICPNPARSLSMEPKCSSVVAAAAPRL